MLERPSVAAVSLFEPLVAAVVVAERLPEPRLVASTGCAGHGPTSRSSRSSGAGTTRRAGRRAPGASGSPSYSHATKAWPLRTSAERAGSSCSRRPSRRSRTRRSASSSTRSSSVSTLTPRQRMSSFVHFVTQLMSTVHSRAREREELAPTSSAPALERAPRWRTTSGRAACAASARPTGPGSPSSGTGPAGSAMRRRHAQSLAGRYGRRTLASRSDRSWCLSRLVTDPPTCARTRSWKRRWFCPRHTAGCGGGAGVSSAFARGDPLHSPTPW